MTVPTPIPDATSRLEALQVDRSFIVQAPAGSGKTELLTQRTLALLACVDVPENILALTFTRKAAAEMRHRIIHALHQARFTEEPTAAHAQLTWRLARAALARSDNRQWHLLENPNRLRIQTIDALCAQLSHSMPILAHSGAALSICEDAKKLYEIASENSLAFTASNQAWHPALMKILLHLDNDHARTIKLFVAMLASREQWLATLMAANQTHNLREHLENALQNIQDDTLAKLKDVFPTALLADLLDLAHFAAQHCDQQSPIRALDQVDADFSTEPHYWDQWLGLTHLLLTSTGEWRKRLDKRVGFPPQTQASNAEEKKQFGANKKRLEELLEYLREDEQLAADLFALQAAPPVHYADAQWEMIEALLQVLPLLCAQLKIIFSQQGVVDFTEVAMGAVHALGSFMDPSELQLRLDHQISHLLVDEFQDTSNAQFTLLSLLTQGWSPDDGRSLFLVGDPMQSIYRFRQAEVGLFLKARNEGINDIQLKSLQLTVNFRSDSGVIDWVNQTFSRAFPLKADISKGAVPYSASTAIRPNSEMTTVQWLITENKLAQAELISETIAQLRQTHPTAKISILVRARTQLPEMIAALTQKSLPYQAVELERLIHKPMVRDLWSLTRALRSPADRIAWLSVLRAPWCGLTLDDLHLIAHSDHQKPIWDLLSEVSLSETGQTQLNFILPIFSNAISHRRRQSLTQTIADCWLALGGPGLYGQDAIEDATAFFEFLQAHEEGGDILDASYTEKRLEILFAKTSRLAENPIQIMTIHKAKGLEFDIVFLPGLDRKPAKTDSPLLYYTERPRSHGKSDLILAPIQAAEDQHEAIYQWLRNQDREKEHLETTRLLYVAATRAKQQLYCAACLTLDEEGQFITPDNASLLGKIWPAVQHEITAIKPVTTSVTPETKDTPLLLNRRDASKPLAQTIPLYTPTQLNPSDPSLYVWSSSQEQLAGTLLHRQLQWIADLHATQFQLDDAWQAFWSAQLRGEGYSTDEISATLNLCRRAIRATLDDPRGQWILLNGFQTQHSELSLLQFAGTHVKTKRLDRTFIDNDGIRWIIDYKITDNLDPELHTQQLNDYAKLLSQMEPHVQAISCGIYYPLSQTWHEWIYRS